MQWLLPPRSCNMAKNDAFLDDSPCGAFLAYFQGRTVFSFVAGYLLSTITGCKKKMLPAGPAEPHSMDPVFGNAKRTPQKNIEQTWILKMMRLGILRQGISCQICLFWNISAGFQACNFWLPRFSRWNWDFRALLEAWFQSSSLS